MCLTRGSERLRLCVCVFGTLIPNTQLTSAVNICCLHVGPGVFAQRQEHVVCVPRLGDAQLFVILRVFLLFDRVCSARNGLIVARTRWGRDTGTSDCAWKTVCWPQGLAQMLTSTMQHHMAVASLGHSSTTPIYCPFHVRYFASWVCLHRPTPRAHSVENCPPKMILFSPLTHRLVSPSDVVPRPLLPSPRRCFHFSSGASRSAMESTRRPPQPQEAASN